MQRATIFDYSRVLALLMLLALTSLGAFADDWKIVERSEKKVPEWVNDGQRSGTLLVTSVSPSLQEARSIVERTLMRSIVQAIATNVNASSTQTDSNLAEGDKVTTREEYLSNLEIAAAKLPFIKGVSLSEALGQYWERRENKSSKQSLYHLTVLYPMPDSELEKMRHNFEKYDGEKTAEFKRWSLAYNEVNSVEQISSAVASLAALEEYFFDSVRKAEASGLRKRYTDLYGMVTMSSAKTGDREFTVRTTLHGKPFATGKMPEVTSECASRITVDPIENGMAFRITYSDEDCLPDEPNSLKANLRLNSARLSTTMHF